ncbi:hypothetical protein H2201_001075 [Coniosporium apollinis]|uniref:HhH-GPD domain-containing protein n=1 Tax=Coniosporium apollinis TaxID=61459 RepID=A0ABQ9P2J0_9PEZI|nr:hypothetical protein H2201_001075 [Coniosporium apollinis]
MAASRSPDDDYDSFVCWCMAQGSQQSRQLSPEAFNALKARLKPRNASDQLYEILGSEDVSRKEFKKLLCCMPVEEYAEIFRSLSTEELQSFLENEDDEVAEDAKERVKVSADDFAKAGGVLTQLQPALGRLRELLLLFPEMSHASSFTMAGEEKGPPVAVAGNPVTVPAQSTVSEKELYQLFGEDNGWTRKEFRQFLKHAPPEEVEELYRAASIDPFSEDATVATTNDDPQVAEATMAKTLKRKKSKQHRGSAPPSKQHQTRSRAPTPNPEPHLAPVSASASASTDNLSTSLTLAVSKNRVRIFAKQHAFNTNASLDQTPEDLEVYLRQVRNFAEKCGLSRDEANECGAEAELRYGIVKEWLEARRVARVRLMSTEALLSRGGCGEKEEVLAIEGVERVDGEGDLGSLKGSKKGSKKRKRDIAEDEVVKTGSSVPGNGSMEPLDETTSKDALDASAVPTASRDTDHDQVQPKKKKRKKDKRGEDSKLLSLNGHTEQYNEDMSIRSNDQSDAERGPTSPSQNNKRRKGDAEESSAAAVGAPLRSGLSSATQVAGINSTPAIDSSAVAAALASTDHDQTHPKRKKRKKDKKPKEKSEEHIEVDPEPSIPASEPVQRDQGQPEQERTATIRTDQHRPQPKKKKPKKDKKAERDREARRVADLESSIDALDDIQGGQARSNQEKGKKKKGQDSSGKQRMNARILGKLQDGLADSSTSVALAAPVQSQPIASKVSKKEKNRQKRQRKMEKKLKFEQAQNGGVGAVDKPQMDQQGPFVDKTSHGEGFRGRYPVEYDLPLEYDEFVPKDEYSDAARRSLELGEAPNPAVLPRDDKRDEGAAMSADESFPISDLDQRLHVFDCEGSVIMKLEEVPVVGQENGLESVETVKRADGHSDTSSQELHAERERSVVPISPSPKRERAASYVQEEVDDTLIPESPQPFEDDEGNSVASRDSSPIDFDEELDDLDLGRANGVVNGVVDDKPTRHSPEGHVVAAVEEDELHIGPPEAVEGSTGMGLAHSLRDNGEDAPSIAGVIDINESHTRLSPTPEVQQLHEPTVTTHTPRDSPALGAYSHTELNELVPILRADSHQEQNGTTAADKPKLKLPGARGMARKLKSVLKNKQDSIKQGSAPGDEDRLAELDSTGISPASISSLPLLRNAETGVTETFEAFKRESPAYCGDQRGPSEEVLAPKRAERAAEILDLYARNARWISLDEALSESHILVTEVNARTASPLRKKLSTGDPSPITTPRKRTGQKSPHFNAPTPPKKPRSPAGTVSCLPFPPLSAPRFGLIQEELAHDPFRLLIAVTLLNKTKGTAAIPVFHSLISTYPTPSALAQASTADVAARIRHLGLQNNRAETLVEFAKTWLAAPPARGKRYKTLHYPYRSASAGIKATEILDDDDTRLGAWEVAHLPGCGPYAMDSWRIFCRDVLRGVAQGWDGEGAEGGFEPEWKRVLPKDKELRAFLRWMWLREGWAWDPGTGEKEVASTEVMRAAERGELVWDEHGGLRMKGGAGEEGKVESREEDIMAITTVLNPEEEEGKYSRDERSDVNSSQATAAVSLLQLQSGLVL